MAARLSAFVIWALVAAGTVFWGYRFWAPPTAMPPNVQFVAEAPALRGDLSRLLGAAPAAAAVTAAPPAESSRFRLIGVLAPRAVDGKPKVPGPEGSGVALIAIDGKPSRAFVVGSPVEGDLMLMAVSQRSASLGGAQGAPSVVLELPPLPPPATGTLPRAVSGADASQPGRLSAGAAVPPGGAMRPLGAAPAGALRSPAFQAQRPVAQAPGAEADDDEEDAPAPPPLRPGAPAAR